MSLNAAEFTELYIEETTKDDVCNNPRIPVACILDNTGEVFLIDDIEVETHEDGGYKTVWLKVSHR